MNNSEYETEGITPELILSTAQTNYRNSKKMLQLLASCYPSIREEFVKEWEESIFGSIELSGKGFIDKYENSELYQRALKLKAFI